VLPCIPLLLLLATLTAYIPFFHSILQPGKTSYKDISGPVAKDVFDPSRAKRSSTSSNLSGNVQIVKTPEEAWSRVSIERPKEIVTVDMLEKEGRAVRGGGSSWRESFFRSSARIGVGVAV
jgi:hypothetical protein